MNLLNTPDANAYPIVSFTYLIVYKELNVIPEMTQDKSNSTRPVPLVRSTRRTKLSARTCIRTVASKRCSNRRSNNSINNLQRTNIYQQLKVDIALTQQNPTTKFFYLHKFKVNRRLSFQKLSRRRGGFSISYPNHNRIRSHNWFSASYYNGLVQTSSLGTHGTLLKAEKSSVHFPMLWERLSLQASRSSLVYR